MWIARWSDMNRSTWTSDFVSLGFCGLETPKQTSNAKRCNKSWKQLWFWLMAAFGTMISFTIQLTSEEERERGRVIECFSTTISILDVSVIIITATDIPYHFPCDAVPFYAVRNQATKDESKAHQTQFIELSVSLTFVRRRNNFSLCRSVKFDINHEFLVETIWKCSMCPGDRNKQTVVAGTLQKWTKSEEPLARAKANKRMNVLLFRFCCC